MPSLAAMILHSAPPTPCSLADGGHKRRPCVTRLCYNLSVAETLTIRLDPEDRAVLEATAHERGLGLSAFVRDLAESEARRLRREAIRAEGERVLAHLAEHPEAQVELEEIGTPISETG